MRYAFLVAWREYAENAKTKGFWLGIFVMPLILFLSIQVPVWLEQKATPIRYYVLVDQSGSLAPIVEARLESLHQQKVLEALNDYARKYSRPPAFVGAASHLGEFSEANPLSAAAFMSKGGKRYFLEQLKPQLKENAPDFQEPRRLFQPVHLPTAISAEAPLATLAQELKPYFRGEKQLEANGQQVLLSAAILIPRDLENLIIRPRPPSSHREADPAPRLNTENIQATNHPLAASKPGLGGPPGPTHQIQYWSANASDSRLRDEIEHAINAEIRQREYLARGLDSAAIHEVERTFILFASLNPKKAAGKETVSQTDTIRQWLPSAFVYLLWLAIFVVIQMLLNNTIEEKSNRIIEVLLSSVTPGELMMGKLFGIAAIGLTMVGAWVAALFGILSWKSGGASEIAGNLLSVVQGSSLVPLFAVYFFFGYLMYAAFILSIGSVCNTIKEAQSYMSLLTIIMMVPLLTMTFIPKDPNGPLARLLSWIPIYTPFTMMNRAAADPPMIDLIGTLFQLLVVTATALWMAGKIFRIGILRTGQPPRLVEMLRWATRKDA